MAAKVRVPRTFVAFGGWRGLLEIEGTVLKVVGLVPPQRLDIDCALVKRCSFNTSNGLWAFRMKDGQKYYLQMSGAIFSADRSEEGKAATEQVSAILDAQGVRGFWV